MQLSELFKKFRFGPINPCCDIRNSDVVEQAPQPELDDVELTSRMSNCSFFSACGSTPNKFSFSTPNNPMFNSSPTNDHFLDLTLTCKTPVEENRRESILHRSSRSSRSQIKHKSLRYNMKTLITIPKISRPEVAKKAPRSRIPRPIGTRNIPMSDIQAALGDTVIISGPGASSNSKLDGAVGGLKRPYKSSPYSPWAVVSVHPFQLRRKSAIYREKVTASMREVSDSRLD